MAIKKAVITAAARVQRTLPLQTLIDRDGNEKSLLRILIEQSLAAGVENIAVVVFPGDEHSYAQSAGSYANSVTFVPQPEPRGYGHAIHCARSFTKDDPFLHIVGDHDVVIRYDHGAALQERLASLRTAGHAIVLTTHDLERAAPVATRLAVLHRGRIVWAHDGPAEPVVIATAYQAVITGRA